MVEVDFIVVDAYSPYTAIVAKPWLHALEVISYTLHQKVKYPSNGQVKEIIGNQSMARQCMVATILHRPNARPQPLLKETYSNQKLQYYPTMDQPMKQSAKT